MEEIEKIEEPKLNKKDITSEIMGDPFFDLNVDCAAPDLEAQRQPLEEEENPIVDVIDVGLDFAEDFLKEAGYPGPKRKIWEDHGKKAMSKALNAYCPPGSAVGGVIDTPLVALLIGVGALILCFYPVISHFLKMKDEQKEELPPGDPEKIEGPKYEKPSTEISSTAPISRDDKRPIDRLMANNVHAVDLPGF